MSAIKEKSAKFRAEIVSAEKRKYFEDARKKMLDARRDEEREVEWEAEQQIMALFKTRQEY